MEVIKVPIGELKAAEYNPRQATEKQVAELKASLEKFGFAEPIIVNKNKDRQNVIVGGHFRVRVAKDMGHTEVPVVYVDLSLPEERELNLRLNKNLGEWDWDKLANEFDKSMLDGVGFSDIEFGKFADKVEDEPEPKPKEKKKCPQCGYIM